MLVLLFAVVVLLFAVVVLLFAVVVLLCVVARRGGGGDDRSPSPSFPLRKSRGRMQTPSAATKSQAAAKSDLPPRGRTMTRSASRAASRGCPPQAADNVKIAAAAAAAHSAT